MIVAEIPGEKTEEFVSDGRYALLRRVMFSAGEAASACIRVAPGAMWAECLWTEDAPEEELEEWQLKLMEATEIDDG